MTTNFQKAYTDGVNHHDGENAQLNFFIRSSALTRAFLLAKEQTGLAIHKPQIIDNMFDVIGAYGYAVSDDSKRMFIANLGGYVADSNNSILTQRYTKLITSKVA